MRRLQLGHGRVVAGVAHQVVATESLDRDDPALGEELPGRTQRVLVTGQGHAFPADQFEPRSAVGTGDRLGVEAPVERVLVLRPAGPAHLEVRHRGGGPVVRKAGDDREPGATVRAGDERVAVAPVRRIDQLLQAVPAGGDVGRDQCPGPVGRAGALDGEARTAARRQFARTHVLDDRERRGVGAQTAAELLHGPGRSLDLGEHPVAGVRHRAREQQFRGGDIDERPEAHALHDAAHLESAPDPLLPAAAHHLQPRQGLTGLRPVDELDGEAHMEKHPVVATGRLVEHADVDAAPGALHVHQSQLARVPVHDLHDAARNA